MQKKVLSEIGLYYGDVTYAETLGNRSELNYLITFYTLV